ncbi:MAG: glycoside hydrolase family 2 protein [Lachnospiraceae bacterium]|nr:glycoside hydrolase family 2 protein [Lachnospiraceae bacterium]
MDNKYRKTEYINKGWTFHFDKNPEGIEKTVSDKKTACDEKTVSDKNPECIEKTVSDKKTACDEKTVSEEKRPVDIPHSFNDLTMNYCNEKDYQAVGIYEKIIPYSEAYDGKKVVLTIDGAAHESVLSVNGKAFEPHRCGYTAASYDISPYLVKDSDNVVSIKVDSREILNQPPFGKVIDYMTYGGIYRDVYITTKNRTNIADAYIYTDDIDYAKNVVKVGYEITLDNEKDIEKNKYAVNITVREGGALITPKETDKILTQKEISVDEKTISGSFEVTGIKLWDIDNPNLYQVCISLSEENEVIDQMGLETGFRIQEFKKDGFYLNGKKIKLIGLNRHQSYPYIGYAMPKRGQITDANILKKELGVNAVRTSHYPQHHEFIRECDRLGLLVFTEIPGWQHIGDEEWKKIAIKNVEDMVIQYRNHPSIILWGVRINESVDDDEFYSRTNEAAHKLDKKRQTSGVRYLQKSSLLEDVYAYNDFVHNGKNQGVDPKKKVTSDSEKPYLVSEFNGHMFPTKSWDSEEHRLEHALRHCNVIDEVYKQEDIAGAFGWCMFDYNTHKDFGSGDRICYHGVMDFFRNPKMAAYVYATQLKSDDVFEISSSMDIGEHPACNLSQVYAFTNADSVRVYKNDEYVREYTRDDSPYKNMPNPPILINDFIGELLEKHEKYPHKKAEAIKEVMLAIQRYGQNSLPLKYKLKMAKLMLFEHLTLADGYDLYGKYVADWGGEVTTYKFEAVKDGKVVKTILKTPSEKVSLEIESDTAILHEEETYDVASVRIKAKDQNGNVLPYFNEVLNIRTEGPVEILGPDAITLPGGMGGCFVRTVGKTGEGEVIIEHRGVEYRTKISVI